MKSVIFRGEKYRDLLELNVIPHKLEMICGLRFLLGISVAQPRINEGKVPSVLLRLKRSHIWLGFSRCRFKKFDVYCVVPLIENLFLASQITFVLY